MDFLIGNGMITHNKDLHKKTSRLIGTYVVRAIKSYKISYLFYFIFKIQWIKFIRSYLK